MNKEELILLSTFTGVNRDKISFFFKKNDNNIDDYDDIDEYEDHEDDFDMPKYREYINVLLSPESIDDIYTELLDGMYFTSSVDLQDVLVLLCKYYIIGYQNKHNATYDILVNKDFKFIYKFFKTNKIFACELLNNFYLCKIYEIDNYNIKIDDEVKNKFDCDNKIMFISDYMRFRYELCVNELMEYGVSHDKMIKILYLALNGDDLSFLGFSDLENLDFIQENRKLMTRIIYSDIFEDTTNWQIDNDESSFIVDNISYCINMNKYVLPSGDEALLIIDRFTDLIFDPASREFNRNSLDDVSLRILKRVNPVYKTERVMLGYENK